MKMKLLPPLFTEKSVPVVSGGIPVGVFVPISSRKTLLCSEVTCSTRVMGDFSATYL